MKLSDIMSAAGLAIYAEIALVIFFLVFLLVVWRVLRGKKEWNRARYLPLDDGPPATREEKNGHE
jgi:cbb3-type cytochrome oxidase subunit 3